MPPLPIRKSTLVTIPPCLCTREAEAREVLKYLKTVPYHQLSRLSDYLSFEYLHAGHILGSAMIRLNYRGKGAETILCSTGDLGRSHQPVIKDPETIERADYLLLESTYDNRVHEKNDILSYLQTLIEQVVQSGGSLIIPAFAVGRSQSVLYFLRQLEEAGRISVVPIFLDSPMAVSAVSVYCSHLDEHDFEMESLMAEACVLETGSVRMVKTTEESKALNQLKDPCIIISISASGNLSGGRILHHLKSRLPDPRNTVLFVGYQPEGSLGRLISEGKKEVKIHGKQVAVRARIELLDGLSAHADSEEILEWVSHLKHPPSRIFLVHGEPEAQEGLKGKLEKVITSKIEIPEYLEEVELR